MRDQDGWREDACSYQARRSYDACKFSLYKMIVLNSEGLCLHGIGVSRHDATSGTGKSFQLEQIQRDIKLHTDKLY